MKLIRYFVNFTAIFSAFGVILLLNDGELDIYAIWNIVTLGLACYYMHKSRSKDE